MKLQSKLARRPKEIEHGFGLVELVVVAAIMVIMMAVAVPYALDAYRSYQLNDAAVQVSGVLKFTRLEAVRLNTPINCLIQQTAGPETHMWADSDKSGTEQSTEKQALFSGSVTLLPAGGVPNTSGLASDLGAPALTAVSSINGTVTFDQRGAVSPIGVYALYVGNTVFPSVGYRAVIVMPSGAVTVWTADAQGNWRQTN